jgi:hypothetical protein
MWAIILSTLACICSAMPATTTPTPFSGRSCIANVYGRSLSGTCRDTSSCKTSGRASVGGYCREYGPDIQCCVTPQGVLQDPERGPFMGRSCIANVYGRSLSGTCRDSGSCKTSGRASVGGYCREYGPDIQCCVTPQGVLQDPERGPFMGRSCVANVYGRSVTGSCRDTSSCKTSGRASVGGFCREYGPDIQCCVPPQNNIRRA